MVENTGGVKSGLIDTRLRGGRGLMGAWKKVAAWPAACVSPLATVQALYCSGLTQGGPADPVRLSALSTQENYETMMEYNPEVGECTQA